MIQAQFVKEYCKPAPIIIASDAFISPTHAPQSTFLVVQGHASKMADRKYPACTEKMIAMPVRIDIA